MPKVPQINWPTPDIPEKRRNKFYDNPGTKDIDTFVETRTTPVRVRKLEVFKCSKCGESCNSGLDIKRHWLENHD